MAWLPFSSKRIPVSVLTKDYSGAVAAKKQIVFLHGSNSDHADIFSTVGSDSTRLIFTEADGTTYVLHSVVHWNYTGTASTSYAVIVLNRTIQQSAAETLYLYYGTQASGSVLFSENFSSFDTTYTWTEYDPNNVLTVADGKLSFADSTASTQSVSITTKNKVLTGDFDVQIDLTISTLGSSSSLAPRLVVKGTSVNFGVAYQSGGVGIFAYQASETGQSDSFYVVTGIASGKLRLTRTSGTLRAYIWNASQSRWEWNGSTAGRAFVASNTEDLYIQVYYYKGSSGSMLCSADNLIAYGSRDFKDSNTYLLAHPLKLFAESPIVFREADGANPNPTLFYEADAAGRLTVQGGKVQFLSTSGASEQAVLMSYGFLAGDFDITVDFDCPTFTCSSSFGAQLQISDTVTTSNWWQLNYQSGAANSYYNAAVSTSDSADIYSTTVKLGKHRFTRSGSTIKAYIWNAGLSRWEWNGSTAGKTFTLTSSNPVRFRLFCLKNTDGSLTTKWSNLTVVSGAYNNLSDQQLDTYTYSALFGGSPTFSYERPGGGVSLNGTTNFLVLGRTADFTSEAFSFSCFVNLSSVANSPVLFCNGNVSTAGYFCQINSNGSISFTTSQSGASQTTTSSTGVITTGADHAVTITRSGAAVKIYVDGADVTASSGTHVNPASSSTGYLFFGTTQAATSNFLTGILGGISIHTEAKGIDWVRAEHYSLLGTALSWGTAETAPTLVIACAGQSNCWNFFYPGYQGTEPDPGSSARMYDSGLAFKNVTGDGARRMATTLLNSGNVVNVTLIHHSQGGTGLDPAAHNNIGYWLDTAANSNYDILKSVVAASGLTPKYFVWIQGETDADFDISKATYKADLGTLWTRVKADLGCTTMLIWGLGRTFATSITSAATEDIRAAQREFAADNADVVIAGEAATFTLQDFIHYDSASRLKMGERTAAALLTLEGYASGYSGPAISGATLISPTTITVSLTHALGSDFTPSANISGFFVDGVEVAASKVDATTIQLSGSGFSGSSVVKYLYGTYGSKQISGTISSGTTTKAVSTTTNFTTAGVVAGDQFYNASQANYSSTISSITTTTNANDTVNMTTAAPLVNGAGNTYKVMANRFVFDNSGWPLQWAGTITLDNQFGGVSIFGCRAIVGKDIFGGLLK